MFEEYIENGSAGILCKLDMKKTYGHVNWDFLFYLRVVDLERDGVCGLNIV